MQKMVEEGGTYKLENVMVGFKEGNYKLLPHKYKLNMMGNSRFTKVNASNVPQNMLNSCLIGHVQTFLLCMLPFHFVVIVVLEGNIFLNCYKTSINYICFHFCDLFD